MELAIDFEAFSQLRLKEEETPISKRATEMRRLVRKLNGCCAKIGKPPAFPATEENKVYSLRPIGGPAVPGYDRRPWSFTRPEITIDILENQLKSKKKVTSGWGTAVPKYTGLLKAKKESQTNNLKEPFK